MSTMMLTIYTRYTSNDVARGKIIHWSSLLFLSVLLVAMLILTQTAQANNNVPLPPFGTNKHLGITDCTSSTCHGGTKAAVDSTVDQNEFFKWNRKDEHSNAYKHLKNDLSKRIAKNLGLKKPAHEEKICLDCHAHNVPMNKRGPRFQISDGVACEACHGGASGWVKDHIAQGAEGKDAGKIRHQQNIKNGLYPTDQPIARAKLCLSCHFGDKTKFVTHRIMGAGHPRLKFELDTYTATQPAHFTMDADYRQRKQGLDGTQVWAIGQAVAAGSFLDKLMAGNGLSAGGLSPELSLFDCQSCHHEMKNRRWTGHTGAGPGVVRINDGSLVLLQHAIGILDPARSSEFKNGLRRLHQATAKSKKATLDAADKLRGMIGSLATEFTQRPFTKEEKRALLKAIVKDGVKGRYADYIVAEQGIMAMDAISNSMGLRLNLGSLYKLFDGGKSMSEDHPNYNISAYKNGLRAVAGQLN